MNYPCTKCGACCRRIDKSIEHVKRLQKINERFKAISDFPYTFDKTGRCENLQDDNTCKVYDHRPAICKLDVWFTFFDMPLEEFYAMNIEACNEAMKEDGIFEIYKIVV